MKHHIQRRQFLALTGSAFAISATGVAFAAPAPKPNSLVRGVQVGVISYSYREMPDQSADALLRYCQESGVSGLELCADPSFGDPAEYFAGAPQPDFSWARMRELRGATTDAAKAELADVQAKQKAFREKLAAWRATAPVTGFEKFRQKYEAAGVKIYAYKPDTGFPTASDAEVDFAFRAAKALGASHVTIEMPTVPAQTTRLSKAAEKAAMKIGYHAHTQATPTFWDAALAESPAAMINLDLGHYVAADVGPDALDLIRKRHDRIISMHVKDRKTKANGGANLPLGEGDTPVTAALRLVRDSKWQIPMTIEMEYQVPQDSTAVKEVGKCVAYCKKALAT